MRNLLLRISIVPVIFIVAVLILVTLISAFYIEKSTIKNVNNYAQHLMDETTEALKVAGERSVREHAEAIVRQVELFFRYNPGLTREQLQHNRDFRSIVLQGSREGRYSLAVAIDEKRIIIHGNRECEGMSLDDYTREMKETYPAVERDDFFSGYFWGRIPGRGHEKRFIYLKKVARPAADGKYIGIACATSYSEFVHSLNGVSDRIEKNINEVLRSTRHFLLITLIIVLVVLVFGFIATLIHYTVQVRRIFWPIGTLLDGTRQVGEGNLDHRIYIGEPVEFSMLANAFNRMTGELRENRDELEEKVRQRTEQIELSEQRYRNLVESTNDIIFTLDKDFRFLSINAALRRQLGFDPSEIVGTFLQGLIHSASEKEAQIDQSIFMDKLRSLGSSERTISIKTLFRQKYSREPRDLRLKLEYLETGLGIEILGKASSVTRDSLQALLSSESQSYITNNRLIDAENISQRITRNLVKFVDHSTAVGIRISVREMIINAIEHGNLEISYREKSDAQENGTYMELFNDRQENPVFKERKVEVDYALSQFEFSVRIRDEGKGFDYNRVLNQGVDNINREMLMHGRGVAMARATFDRVVYIGKGNEVFLVKHIRQS